MKYHFCSIGLEPGKNLDLRIVPNKMSWHNRPPKTGGHAINNAVAVIKKGTAVFGFVRLLAKEEFG